MNCHGLSWIYKDLIVSVTAIGKNKLETILNSKWSLPLDLPSFSYAPYIKKKEKGKLCIRQACKYQNMKLTKFKRKPRKMFLGNYHRPAGQKCFILEHLPGLSVN